MIDENNSLLQVGLNNNNPSNNFAVFAAEERFEPCRVCGEPSSGWHCGAVTCEACKKFFLRSINGEDQKYRCVRNKDCVIQRSTRTQCQFCRFKKCKEVGMTINENPNNPTVAELFKAFPCTVCSAPSSGVHFGAVTCEGCKGFFRRSIKERAPERYKCMDNRQCEVNVATRNMCRYCRFHRCLAAGMSAQNSRIGRQSNLFKHHIIELQRRGCTPSAQYLNSAQRRTKSSQRKLLNSEDDTYSYSYMQNTNTNPHLYNTNHDQNYIYNNDTTTKQHMQNMSNDLQPINYDNSMQMYMQQPNDQMMNSTNMMHDYYYNPTANTVVGNHQMTNNHQHLLAADTTMPSTSNTLYPPHHDTHSMQTNMITGGYMHPQIDTIFDDHLSVFIKALSKNYICLKKSILEVIHQPTIHMKISHLTNTYSYDKDSSGDITDITMEIFKEYANYFTKFCENIPEMMSLGTDDQNEMIKSSIHSIVLLVSQQQKAYLDYFNCGEFLFLQISKIFPVYQRTIEFLRNLHAVCENFKLDDYEYALYSALLIISPANRNIINFDRISEYREKIAEVLRKYMYAKRNEENTYDDLLLLLVGLRKFNKILQDGMLDAYQRTIRKDTKLLNLLDCFSKVYLPKNMII